MADKLLVINKNISETRIALVENSRVVELFIERHQEPRMVGNIYKAKVIRVLPGMQSAFVDIGAERTAFLYGGDVIDPAYLEKKRKEAEQGGDDSFSDTRDETTRTPIENLLREGQELTVQVAKEPLGTKGARVTTFLSIPGRYLVLMPEFTHVGISRRIDNDALREQLREIVDQLKPRDVGVIVRTAAANAKKEDLQKDLRYLLKAWKSLKSKQVKAAPPALLYQEPDIPLKITRDLYDDEIDKIIVDDQAAYDDLRRFLSATIPGASEKLQFHNHANPVFDEYGLEVDIGRALGRKVWLPSGGYLVIDQTEALTSFDVNTGRFVGKASAQETILKTNLEAAREIVAQLRLRNIGGIIIIDFIDMVSEADRDRVVDDLEQALKSDKAKTNVLKISELGLVQMTRKRTSESLEHQLMDICPLCEGRGRVRSTSTEVYDMVRDIERHVIITGQKQITVRVRPDIRKSVEHEEKALLEQLTTKLDLEITFVNCALHLDHLKEPAYEVF